VLDVVISREVDALLTLYWLVVCDVSVDAATTDPSVSLWLIL